VLIGAVILLGQDFEGLSKGVGDSVEVPFAS
jgi:hypothetical protein